MALYPALKEYYDYISAQEKSGKLPPQIDKSLLESILNDKIKECPVCGSTIERHAVTHIYNLLEQFDVSSATAAELNKTLAALKGFFAIIAEYPAQRERLFSELQDIKDKIKQNQEEYENVTSRLASVPNSDEVAQAVINREAFRKDVSAKLVRKGGEVILLNTYNKTIEDLEQDLTKATARNKKAAIIRKKEDFCNTCIAIMKETKDEVLNECRSDMQSETLDLFKQLIWKKNSFSNISIRQDYTFELLDMYGNQTLGSCSAAERTLLALSFTLALQKTTKHDSMLFIDTPIGRVDPYNRMNIMSILLDVAKNKQVILTFQPSEYDDNVKEKLSGKCNTFTKLAMDEESGLTNIAKS